MRLFSTLLSLFLVSCTVTSQVVPTATPSYTPAPVLASSSTPVPLATPMITPITPQPTLDERILPGVAPEGQVYFLSGQVIILDMLLGGYNDCVYEILVLPEKEAIKRQQEYNWSVKKNNMFTSPESIGLISL